MLTGGWIIASLALAKYGPNNAVKFVALVSLILALLQTGPGRQFADMLRNGQQGVDSTVKHASGRPAREITAGVPYLLVIQK